MKLSLKFFYTKIGAKIPGATLRILPNQEPKFSALGIITDSAEVSEDIVYIDLFGASGEVLPEGASVITMESSAQKFKQCNLITVPDGTDLAQVTQMVSHIFTRYFGWAEAVYGAITKNMDLQTIIDLTTPIIQNPIYIADSSFKMLASWGGDFMEVNPTWRYQQRYHYLPYQVLQGLIETGELYKLQQLPQAWRIENSAGFTALPYISKAIRKDGMHYGNFFIIELYGLLDACDLEIADYLGEVLSTALSGNLNYLETSTLYHAHFLQDIVEGTLTDKQIMLDQLRALGWLLEGDYLVCLIDIAEDNDAIRHHMMALLVTGLEAQCLSYQGNIMAIINNATPHKATIVSRLRQLGRDFNRTIALSETFSDFSQIGMFYQQTLYLLNSSTATAKGSFLLYDDVSLDHLIDMSKDNVAPYTPVSKLFSHDKQHRTEFCHTLMAWLMLERNSAKTAKELYIHRNTLNNRLARIGEIVDINLEDPAVRIRTLLSLYALRSEFEEEKK